MPKFQSGQAGGFSTPAFRRFDPRYNDRGFDRGLHAKQCRQEIAVIEHLLQTRGPAFGFAVHGVLTASETKDLITKLDHMIGGYKKPIGVLADLSRMEGADWTARWDEMRFLKRYTDQIARLAIVGASDWETMASTMLVATAALQAQTLYFKSSELAHAWHWVKMLKHDEDMPVRMIFPGHGLFQNYTPEYMGI